MRHKYDTQGITLARTHTGEAHTLVTVLTNDLGLVRARAQSVRKPGAKLASGLTTFTESALVLVQGKEGWRLTGAVLDENWFGRLETREARTRAADVVGLLLRLVPGEAQDTELFTLVRGFFSALTEHPIELHEAVEILAVLRMLSILGLDTGAIPGTLDEYPSELLGDIGRVRAHYVARVNEGIAASGL